MSTLAIVGSRGLRPTKEEIDTYVAQVELMRDDYAGSTTRYFDHVVTGGAGGVDTAATCYAISRRMEFAVHLPNWDKHGRRAGAIRNQQIVDAAEALLAIWDGKSPGTLISIRMARDKGIPTMVIVTKRTSSETK